LPLVLATFGERATAAPGGWLEGTPCSFNFVGSLRFAV
jgi:hypothetical protein